MLQKLKSMIAIPQYELKYDKLRSTLWQIQQHKAEKQPRYIVCKV